MSKKTKNRNKKKRQQAKAKAKGQAQKSVQAAQAQAPVAKRKTKAKPKAKPTITLPQKPVMTLGQLPKVTKSQAKPKAQSTKKQAPAKKQAPSKAKTPAQPQSKTSPSSSTPTYQWYEGPRGGVSGKAQIQSGPGKSSVDALIRYYGSRLFRAKNFARNFEQTFRMYVTPSRPIAGIKSKRVVGVVDTETHDVSMHPVNSKSGAKQRQQIIEDVLRKQPVDSIIAFIRLQLGLTVNSPMRARK